MGDATNLVLILAGELLKKAEHLIIMGLHPTEVTQGYELACKKALEDLESTQYASFLRKGSPNPQSHVHTLELSTSSLPTPLNPKSLAAALRPAIASKQYGSEDILASLVAEAALAVMPPNPKNFNVDNVRVVKIMGGSLAGSRVVRGMVFNRTPEGVCILLLSLQYILTESFAGVVKKLTKAKVAVFTSGLDIAQTETKGTVLLKTAEEMLNFTTGEEKHMEKVSSCAALACPKRQTC